MSQKPYIARDTGEPLVVFGHYEVDSIGGLIRRPVTSFSKPEATESDIQALDEHGKDGLESLGYYGVLDRLKTSGLI